jgi:acyl-CoA synthetase (NDP forming)
MSCSGGEASVMADSAEGRRLVFPKLDEAHRARVKETLGPLVAVANPLDYHTFIWNNEGAMRQTFSAMMSDVFDLNMLVLDFPRNDRCSDADWQRTLRAFEWALRSNQARGAVVASMPENMPENQARALVVQGVVPLFGIGEAMDAAEAASFIGAAWTRSPPTAIGGVSSDAGKDCYTLDEASAKAMLGEAGLSIPPGVAVSSTTEAARAADAIGYPVALKALGVAHKSEAGAVRLNLANAAAVESAARDLLPVGSGLYVEKMIAGGVAELIVGIARDPLFGPVMTVGTGGILVELLQDSATLLLPASPDEIDNALSGLKMFPLLDGYRGRPKADLQAAVEAIEKIALFAHSHDLEELDINPLIVCGEGKGAWVADALMVLRRSE